MAGLPNPMQAALNAARDMQGQTWPNPAVGCVLVNPLTHEIIAKGATQKGGRPHAEITALQQAGPHARGAHAYITLEPCNHSSAHKPLSCTDGLIQAGIKTAFIALPDPDPRMAGRSIEKLRAAGIETHVGLEAAAAYHSHRGHITRTALHRPYITLKLAHTRDNKLGMAGTRTNISAEASWQRAYDIRGHVDAVMIGINTALADNPRLTNRNTNATHQPVRVVLDSRARLPAQSALAQTAHETPTWLVAASDNTAHLEALGVRILKSDMAIDAVLETLYQAGLGHILAEGGAGVAASLIEKNLVDEALMIEGAITLGDAAIPCPTLQNMVLRDAQAIGPDTWRVYDSATALALKDKILKF